MDKLTQDLNFRLSTDDVPTANNSSDELSFGSVEKKIRKQKPFNPLMDEATAKKLKQLVKDK